MRVTHLWTDDTAVIRVEGLARPLRLLHVTDSHIALPDPDDAPHLEKAATYAAKFQNYRRHATGRDIPADRGFLDAVARARAEQVDLLALTGDIVHFPSRANAAFVSTALKNGGRASLYTAGNHDWHFPGDVGRDELRARCWPALQPIYDQNGPEAATAACSAREIGGVLFLAVDDSTYQIEPAQLEFVRQQLARRLPTVLLVHIPLSIATLREPTLARWKAPILIADPDWGLPSRTEWDTPADRAETGEFVRLCAAAPNLFAVLCGHIHFPHCDALSPQAVQYVTRPGFEGGSRLIELLPLA